MYKRKSTHRAGASRRTKWHNFQSDKQLRAERRAAQEQARNLTPDGNEADAEAEADASGEDDDGAGEGRPLRHKQPASRKRNWRAAEDTAVLWNVVK